MKVTIQLDTKEVRKIIAKYLEIPEEDVIPNRYSFSVANINYEELKEKLENK